MNTVTLQVPMDYALRKSAEKVVTDGGFSSLQEAVRVFLSTLVAGRVGLTFSQTTPDEILTPAQERVLARKYNQAMKELKSGKMLVARTADEFMAQIRAGV